MKQYCILHSIECQFDENTFSLNFTTNFSTNINTDKYMNYKIAIFSE